LVQRERANVRYDKPQLSAINIRRKKREGISFDIPSRNFIMIYTQRNRSLIFDQFVGNFFAVPVEIFFTSDCVLIEGIESADLTVELVCAIEIATQAVTIRKSFVMIRIPSPQNKNLSLSNIIPRMKNCKIIYIFFKTVKKWLLLVSVSALSTFIAWIITDFDFRLLPS
jgi:hypothetical protein